MDNGYDFKSIDPILMMKTLQLNLNADDGYLVYSKLLSSKRSLAKRLNISNPENTDPMGRQAEITQWALIGFRLAEEQDEFRFKRQGAPKKRIEKVKPVRRAKMVSDARNILNGIGENDFSDANIVRMLVDISDHSGKEHVRQLFSTDKDLSYYYSEVSRGYGMLGSDEE